MESATQATESELSGRLATSVVRWYHDRFGRGPTEAKGYLLDRYALVVLGNVQTEVERSLVERGELASVELLRRRVRQTFADELNEIVEGLVGRKVRATLSDHNAALNTTALLFVLEAAVEPDLGDPGEAMEAKSQQARRQARQIRAEAAAQRKRAQGLEGPGRGRRSPDDSSWRDRSA